MRDAKTSLESVLGDFETQQSFGLKERQAVTIWLSPEEKARYDRLQKGSRGTGRRFSEVTREAIKMLISLAEEKVS